MSPKKVIISAILLFIILSSISGIIGILSPIWLLNENQILYLYSTSAQVLSGIYGLTLTGFLFFRNELSREEFEDDSLAEAVNSLKERYFNLLIFITFFSIFTLLICNFAISIESEAKSILKTVIINVAQTSFIVNLLTIAYFIFDVITPKRLEKASNNLQKMLDPIGDNINKGSLENFLKNFNIIESLLQKYGQPFQTTISSYQPKTQRRISNAKLAQIIFQDEKIDNELYNDIKRLITLRNSIVHGAEPIVSSMMVTLSERILTDLSKSLDVNIQEK